MPRRKPGVKIIYRKLGREQARGQYHPDLNIIEIDPRLEVIEHLEVLLHESLHAIQPHHDEQTVARDALNLAHILWSDGYRKTPKTSKNPKKNTPPRATGNSGQQAHNSLPIKHRLKT